MGSSRSREGTSSMHRLSTRTIATIVLSVAVAFVAASCSQQVRAERDGRDLAESVCDLRDASDAEAAQAAIDDIEGQIDDLVERYGVATAEDRADVQNNLADLAEHAIQGNEVLVQQDLTVLQRSAENIRDDTSDVQQAAWTGFADGLQECLAD
jgi:hypothetical protein